MSADAPKRDEDSVPQSVRIEEELQLLAADPATKPIAESLGAMYWRIFRTGDMDEVASAAGLGWLISTVSQAVAEGNVHNVLCIASVPLIDLPYGPDGSYIVDDEYMTQFGTDLRLRDKITRILFPDNHPGVETDRHVIDYEAQLRTVLGAPHLTVRAFETAIPYILLIQAQDPIEEKVKEILVFDAVAEYVALDEAPPLRSPWEVHTGAPPLHSEALRN